MAAGAVVSPGRTVPSGEVWAGAPAKRLRALEPEEAGFLAQAASDYAALAAVHAAENAKSLEEILARPVVCMYINSSCTACLPRPLSCRASVSDAYGWWQTHLCMPLMHSLQPVAILLQEDAWRREDNKLRSVDYDSHMGVSRDPVTRDVIR